MIEMMIYFHKKFHISHTAALEQKQKCFECGWASSINYRRNKSSNDMDRPEVKCYPTWGLANRIHSLRGWCCQTYLVSRCLYWWYSRFEVSSVQGTLRKQLKFNVIWFNNHKIFNSINKNLFKFSIQQNPAYLRVYNSSKLKYSARVNYDVACPMHFEEYPMDTQRCNISFESWGHPCQVNFEINYLHFYTQRS